MPGRDTRTRWQGLYARHRQGCAVEQLAPDATLPQITTACDCEPSYYGKAYDPHTHKHISTKRHATIAAARGARKSLLQEIEKGTLPAQTSPRLREAREQFKQAAEEGRALNKHGRRYKPSALKDVDECLRKHVVPRLGPRPLDEIRRVDVQRLIDELAPTMSGSRVRSVINALRTLYRWAGERDLTSIDPAAGVRLPAMSATPRDRIATPAEMTALLAVLPIEDALPYALAAYGMGRRAQIQRLRWRDIDLDAAALEWGAEEEARKSAAAQRVVPVVKPLLALLTRGAADQKRRASEQLVCPPRHISRAGLLHTRGLAERAGKVWKAHDLVPIGLHECRHTAATWLDAAGVSPKVASVLMGHTTPDQQAGAAQITLARYTHTLPDAIETARRQLNAWLAAEAAKDAKHTGSTR